MRLWRLIGIEMCRRVVANRRFQSAILAIIIANSVYLALDDYSMQTDSDPKIQNMRIQIENSFSVIYIVEFILKVFSMGLVLNKGSYLRDPWNFIDFAIILQIILSWGFGDAK